MGDGFSRFKRLYLLSTLVKSLLLGLTALMLIVAAFLTVIALSDFDFKIIYAVLIGAFVGLVLGVGSFFLFKLNDKRLAKQLDKDLCLKEKIQTMQAFYNENGEITQLQRADAQKELNDAPVNFVGLLTHLLVFLASFVLSFALLVTSVVVFIIKSQTPSEPGDVDEPPLEQPQEQPKEEFEVTDHHKIALEALIKEVEASKLQDDAKQAVIAELTLLLASLDELKFEDDMKAYVIQVIKNVRGIVNTVNTTFKLQMYAGDSQDENLVKLSYALYSLDIATIESELNAIRGILYVEGGSRDKIESLSIELGAALKNSGIANADSLYITLESLYNALRDIVDHPDFSDSNVTKKLDDAFHKSALDGFKALIPQQKINEDVKTRVVEELMRIFGITEEDLTNSKNDDAPPETEEPEDRPEVGKDGGFGTGETVFGSNDIVIDPEANPGEDINSINVEYGTIISRYDAKITEMLAEGKISEELAQILSQYFDVLVTPKENK